MYYLLRESLFEQTLPMQLNCTCFVLNLRQIHLVGLERMEFLCSQCIFTKLLQIIYTLDKDIIHPINEHE